jgi:hypothetical protein
MLNSKSEYRTESKDEVLRRISYGGNKLECFKSEIQNEIAALGFASGRALALPALIENRISTGQAERRGTNWIL